MRKVFTWVYFVTMIGETIIRKPYATKRRKLAKTDQRISASEVVLINSLLTGMIVLPLVYAFTRWLNFADYQWSEKTRLRSGLIGSLFAAATLWVFWRSHHDLDTNCSPTLEINEQHTLVTSGIYSKIRHPMYTSQLLWCIAQVFLIQNKIAGPASLIVSVPAFFLRVSAEEEMMLDHFGAEYEAYIQQTGRILPRLSNQ